MALAPPKADIPILPKLATQPVLLPDIPSRAALIAATSAILIRSFDRSERMETVISRNDVLPVVNSSPRESLKPENVDVTAIAVTSPQETA